MKKSVFLVLAVAFVFFWGGAARVGAFSGENRESTPFQRTIVNSVFPDYFPECPANVTSARQTPPAPQPLLPPPVKTARPAPAPKPEEVRVVSVPKPALAAKITNPAAENKSLSQSTVEKPDGKKPEREVRTQYYLFDRRGPEGVCELANSFQRESAGGGMIVSDLQDRSREYEVPKARFFREEYAVPTKELLESSNTLRMSNSPGYSEKKAQ